VFPEHERCQPRERRIYEKLLAFVTNAGVFDVAGSSPFVHKPATAAVTPTYAALKDPRVFEIFGISGPSKVLARTRAVDRRRVEAALTEQEGGADERQERG